MSLLAYETFWRLAIFIVLLLILMMLEALWPRRVRQFPRRRRWPTNFLMTIINTIALRLLAPLSGVMIALWASMNGIGLFNLIVLPNGLEILLTLILLDAAIWLQHVASHKIPLLWRLHRVHHIDQDIDVTTGIRFHPLEILLSMFYKAGIIACLGASMTNVILFEIILSGCALFNHANWALPRRLDRLLRLVLVTPDMHRVHHSTLRGETDSNYGFALPIWDRLFGTYRAQPAHGHDAMQIGLPEHQNAPPIPLIRSLILPFR